MNMDTSIRYTPPSRFDQAPFGKIVYVAQGDEKKNEIYIQLSPDETNANWQKIGVLFESIFADLSNDKDFIQECLKLLLFKGEGLRFTNLSEILKRH